MRTARRTILLAGALGFAVGVWMGAKAGICIVFSQDPESTCHRLLGRPISDATYRFLVVPSRGLLVGLVVGLIVATASWAWQRRRAAPSLQKYGR